MYYKLSTPPFPFFVYAGTAVFRPGDAHRQRTGVGAFDMIFVTGGALYMQDGDQRYTVGPGQMLVIDPQGTHRSYQPCREQTTFHWLHFRSAAAYTRVPAITFPSVPAAAGTHRDLPASAVYLPVYQSLTPAQQQNTAALLPQLESFRVDKYQHTNMAPLTAEYNQNALARQALFFNLLSQLVIDPAGQPNGQIAQAVMQILQTNYAHDNSLTALAQTVNCHPSHLIRVFKAAYGTTPGQALIHIRIAAAQQLLRNTTTAAKRIAADVGFQSPYYFSSKFKQVVGMTPTQYRQQSADHRR